MCTCNRGICDSVSECKLDFPPTERPEATICHTITAYPVDVLGLGNYVQISNPYTLSKVVGKDGERNPRLQRPTYVHMRVSMNLLFSHVVGMIQPNLNQINANLKGKELPYLDTKTRYVSVGTTNDWCSDALQAILVKELTAHVEVLWDIGYLEGEYKDKKLPLFMVRRAKLKLPQMEILVSREDAEFINYFACLRQCNVLEVADVNWIYFWLLMENFTSGGHLK